jgi:hypothetical protein
MNPCEMINHLSLYIFTKNDKNQQILFDHDIYSYFGIRCNKDLFKFIFEIFYRGIIILYGSNNKVKLNDLSESQFNHMKNRLRYAHIKLNIIIYDLDTAYALDIIDKNSFNEYTVVMDTMSKIDNMNDNKELKDYIFYLYINGVIYSISFDIF